MKEEIGLRIRKLRTDKEFNQASMAEELGLTAGAYAKIERGETDLTVTRLFQIAEVLEVPVYDILEEKGAGKKFKNESLLELQVFKLLAEMEVLKKELKKIPKSK